MTTGPSEQKGTPVIFMIPLRTPTGKFRKKSQSKSGLAHADFLERWLIATSLEKNAMLINNKETSFLGKIHVTGTFNSKKGESTFASRQLCKALY
jgi:hypothetical protein